MFTYITVGIIAWIVNQQAGNRGIFAFDQSFVIDAAYRICRGENLFKDFFAPFGIVSFYYTAFFLKTFGVQWSSYVAGASTINILLAWLQMALLQAVGIKNPLLILATGLTSAAGTAAVFGTVYPEFLACVFGLLGLYLLFLDGKTFPLIKICCSGIVFALAFYTKQNIAAGFLPVLAAALLVFNEERSIRERAGYGLLWIIVAAAATALPALFFTFTGRLDSFYYYYFRLPSELGSWRMRVGNQALLFVLPAIVIFAAIIISAYRKYPGNLSVTQKQQTTRGLLLLFHAFFLQHFLELTMAQDPIMLHMLMGIFICLGMFYLNCYIKHLGFEILAFVRYLAGGALFFSAILFGLNHSLLRLDQETVSGSQFGDPLKDEFFDTLRWGVPTYAESQSRVSITSEDLEKVLAVAREQNSSIFVYPDYSILYPAAGKLPPHPFLWFHPGLTFGSLRKADSIIKAGLIDNKVNTIIIESAYYDVKQRRDIGVFPETNRFIEANFKVTEVFGVFTIYRNNPDLEAGGG